jgi:hypothetical protein
LSLQTQVKEQQCPGLISVFSVFLSQRTLIRGVLDIARESYSFCRVIPAGIADRGSACLLCSKPARWNDCAACLEHWCVIPSAQHPAGAIRMARLS